MAASPILKAMIERRASLSLSITLAASLADRARAELWRTAAWTRFSRGGDAMEVSLLIGGPRHVTRVACQNVSVGR